MYIKHNVVEIKRQSDDYMETFESLNCPPLKDQELYQIEKEFKSAISTYGPEFGHTYGWAAKHLGLKKPTFKDLQKAVDRADFNSFYKLASFNVHATARSLFFSMSTLDDNIIISSRSNAGLLDPGVRTAQALLLITILHQGESYANVEKTVQLKSLTLLFQKLCLAFSRAEKQLERDERAVRKQMRYRREKRSSRQKSNSAN